TGCNSDKTCECNPANRKIFSNCLLQCTIPGKTPSNEIQLIVNAVSSNFDSVCQTTSSTDLSNVLSSGRVNPTQVAQIISSLTNNGANPDFFSSLSSVIYSSSVTTPLSSTTIISTSSLLSTTLPLPLSNDNMLGPLLHLSSGISIPIPTTTTTTPTSFMDSSNATSTSSTLPSLSTKLATPMSSHLTPMPTNSLSHQLYSKRELQQQLFHGFIFLFIFIFI
ncbi:hypothetical protein HMI55_004963, partial [Coelomomyces lativittatus]